MNVQLLLLLALAGPFCAFTHASPTVFPTDAADDQSASPTEPAVEVHEEHFESLPDATAAFTQVMTHEELTVITGPPLTDPPSAPEEVATLPEEVATEAAAAATEAPTPAATAVTDEQVVETDAPAAPTSAAPEAPVTDVAEDTAAPTAAAEAEVLPHVTGAAQAETTNGEVVVENGAEEGLSSGQVVGIVLGALLAVIIVIAVVIAAVRRMGKYSP